MDSLPFDPIELAAVDPMRNIHRRWSIAAIRDLFGRIVVETRWGRLGTPGRQMARSFADEAEAQRYVAALLRLRGTATGRIGVSYRPRTRIP
jgi:predicted DNA-binding WGR domain protein